MKTFATLAAVSMLTLAGAAAVAQTTPPAPPQDPVPQTLPQAQRPDRDGDRQGRWMRTDFDALTDARMAAIQAGLRLNPEQQRLWTPVEQALRAMATHRAERMQERRARMQERRDRDWDRDWDRDDDRDRADRGARDPDRMVENLEDRAQRLTAAAQRVTALSDAMKPFWASLSEDQKRLAPVLMRRGGGEMGRMGGDMRRGRHGDGFHHARHHHDRGMMDHHR
jgi:zinc resistance-associated protein